MSTDWYTKLALSVLAVCAAVLATQELRGSGRPGSGEEEGRFRLQVLPMGRIMLKIDSETGETWRANFPDPKVWRPIAEEPAETLDDETPEAGAEEAGASEPPAAAAPPAPVAPDPMAAGTP